MAFKDIYSHNYIRCYHNKPHDNKQNLITKFLQLFTSLTTIWVITALYMLSAWGNSLSVVVITLFLFVVEYKLIKTYTKIKQKKHTDRKKIWMAGNKCLESIDQLNNNEFIKIVKEILINTGGFSKITDNKFKDKAPGIDLIGFFNNVPIAISCKKTDPNIKLTVRYLHEMTNALDKLGYKSGIIVTNGIIGHNTKAIAEKFNKTYALTLLDRYQLVEYARKAKHKIFPSPQVVEQLVIAEEEQKTEEKIPIKNRLIGHRHKALHYFTAAIILVIMYRLIEGVSLFGVIYLLFALINIILGVISIFHGKSNYEVEVIRAINANKKPG
ncbi:restriction endonuclease [Desulfolucanica intricata]|uniref:restriction endonuclease n=1 Tax=Desulfolucanica intricata TaxID=1285191 RepID=UPI00082B5A10|nr:restriction endonuclease [Desulfolucanica intricata]